MQIFTINELTKKIKSVLETNRTFQNLWVSGEISNFKHHSSGHMYFSLKDDFSCIRAVMFRSRSASVVFRPENGMKVIARGNISLYERDGQYQLYVEEMQPDGIGALHIAFEQLKGKLQAEGLFDASIKKQLPLLPNKIGIVTSPTGAAIRDILTVLNRRCPNLHLILVPVAVQGENAPAQIAEGIQLLNKLPDLDLMIIGRGGGSIEELWAFNTEIVARSIYESSVPVISAVGHEVDYTIADFVADLRAATPSAAAELAVPDTEGLTRHIHSLKTRLQKAMEAYIKEQQNRVNNCLNNKVVKNPKSIVHQGWQQLDYLKRFLEQAIDKVTTEKKNQISVVISKLDALSPLTTLERGYSLCQKNGRILKDSTHVELGEEVDIILRKGQLICKVAKRLD